MNGLWEPVPDRRILSHSRYTGDGLGPVPNDVSDFDRPSWEASPSMGSEWGMGWKIGGGIGRTGGRGNWNLYIK